MKGTGARKGAGFTMEMPFGKHKGEQLADIPTEYLQWVFENCSYIRSDLRAEIGNELADRDSEANSMTGRYSVGHDRREAR